MNYAGYVAAAYAVFVAGMLWDWLSPWWQIRQQRRTASLRARRDAARNGNLGVPEGPNGAPDARHRENDSR